MKDRHYFGFKLQNAMYMITFYTVLAILISAVFAERGVWSKQGSYEYYVSEATSTTTGYTSSQTKCENKDGQLALIKSQETQEFIQSLVLENSGAPYGFYIGLQDTDGDGKFIWDDGIPTDYTNWNQGEPNTFATEKCVIVGYRYTYKSNLPWYNIPCSSASSGTKGYVCERLIGWNWGSWSSWGQCDCPGIMLRNRSCVDTLRSGPYSCNGTEIASQTCSPTGVCNVTLPQATTTPTPKGRGVWIADAGFEYYVSKEGDARTFKGSQQYCSGEGAVLAHVLSPEVQSFIQSLVFSNSGQPYGFYIGLKYNPTKNEYIWSDGTSFGFTNWYTSQPLTGEGECVVMGSPYTYNEKLAWYSAHCAATTDGQKGLVCQRRIGKYWDSWSLWSLCNCSISNQTRSRECINSGRYGPNNCNGMATEVQNCPFDSACFLTSVLATTVPVTTLVPASTEMPTTRAVPTTTPVPTTATVTTTTIVPTETTAMTSAASTTNPTLPTTTPVLATTAVPTTTPTPKERGIWSKQGSYEYYVSEDTSTTTEYTSSQTICKTMDGQLALIKSRETQEFIQSLVVENSGVPYGFYIGLQDTDGDGTFIWDDGTPTDYTNWDAGEPNDFGNEICVVIGNRHTYKSNLPWNNILCNSASSISKGYVCERLIGWNWGSWSSWSQCDCPGIMMRNRSCVDTSRAGPHSCNGTEITFQMTTVVIKELTLCAHYQNIMAVMHCIFGQIRKNISKCG